MAKLKGYITEGQYEKLKQDYKECIRMLNGLEKSLERHIPQKDRRWQISDKVESYEVRNEMIFKGWPSSDP